MTPDRRGIGWWQKIRRAVTGLGAGIAPPDPSVAAPFSWIEPGGLAERLANGAAPIIVDVRGADEFNGKLGHLADALNVALPELPGRIAEFARYRDRDLVPFATPRCARPRRLSCSMRRVSTTSRYCTAGWSNGAGGCRSPAQKRHPALS
jgi:hypothetical protein